MRFVDVTNDIAFRKIFGDEHKTACLISLLNAVLRLEGDQRIASVTLVNPYQLPRIGGEKATIIDVRAVDQAGRNFLVEMQVPSLAGFAKRVQFYACRDYSLQINRGEDYHLLKPTYFVGILDFEFAKGPEYLHHHLILNEQTMEHLLTDIRFTFIELPKFTKSLTELENVIDQWIFFIKNAENLDVIPDGIQDPGLLEAWHAAELHNLSKEEYKEYDNYFIWLQDQRSKLQAAEEKGEQKEKRRGIERSLRMGTLSIPEIADLFEVDEDFVRQIHRELYT